MHSVAEFDALAASTTYVLVDFYADWCPPCKMVAPMFASLADSHAVEGKLAFAKVNVDQQQQLAMRFGITAMPTFLLLKDGRPVSNVRGANPPAIQALVRTAETQLAALAKEEAAKAKAKAKAEESKPDSAPISGGYTMSQGTRSDWKMSLSG